MSDYIDIELRKFDPRIIKKDSKVVIIGKTGTGKTVVSTEVLYYNRDMPGIVIAGTRDGREQLSKIIPDSYIYDKYEKEIIQGFIDRQDQAIKNKQKNPHAFLFLDDLLYDNKWIKDELTKYIFMNGRHDKIMFILTMQYPLGIPPDLRTNIDFVFILRENIIANRKRIYDNYAGMFPTFDVFCKVLDSCTEDFQCLVIHNASRSNRLEDQVFWYKAEIHEPFKMGPKEYWDAHYANYNENYQIKKEEQQEQLKRNKKRYKRKETKYANIVVEKIN